MEQETIRDQGLYGTGDHRGPGSVWNRRSSGTRVCMEQETIIDQGLYGAGDH